MHNTAPERTFIPTASDFGIFYELMFCRNCGIVFSVTDKTEDTINKIYETSKDELYLRQEEERTASFRRILSDIIPYSTGGGRFLDIGCSYGFLLKEARKMGFEVSGIEISGHASRYCRQTLGIPVYNMPYSKFTPPGGECFDIITAIDVIEHIMNPISFISHTYKMLKCGGIFYLVTPDIKSLSSRILRHKWWSYRQMHLFYFSRKVLCSLLEKYGFRIITAHKHKRTLKLGYLIAQLREAAENNTIKYFFHFLGRACSKLNISFVSSFGDIAIMAKKMRVTID